MRPRRLAACLLLAGCAAAAPRQPPPPPAPFGAPEVRAVRVRETLIVDGVDNDAGWRECPETEVPLEGKGPPSCRVKAAVYRGTIFFLVRWMDSTRTGGGNKGTGPWWAHRACAIGDHVGLTFPIVGPLLDEPDPSIPRILDYWEWGAGLDKANGSTGDYVLANPAGRFGSSNWGPWYADLSIGMDEFESPSSRHDVQGCGRWKDGEWTVEIARALSTGHADDRDFTGLAEIPFRMEIEDKGNGHAQGSMDHGHSPVLRLLLPPPEDALKGPLPEPLGPPGGGR